MPTTAAAVLRELKRLGTAQNVTIYRRHGAGEDVYGVSFGNLRPLAKRLGTDHALALALWDSGNADARCLATMVADPAALTRGEADAWVEGIDYYVHADLVGGLVARTPFALEAIDGWTRSDGDFVRQTGYVALASYLRGGKPPLSDAACRRWLKRVEREIHESPNRSRHAMNGALIAIGVFRPELAAEAVAAAGRIGTVEVDHGETGCKTPAAVPYIERSLARSKTPATA
ncbi:MAG TPA: DNA alkylation repair protein [Gaiellaceae bacterium]|nr:DNA alkylation repair protein [Gaiellaceae bacterium]